MDIIEYAPQWEDQVLAAARLMHSQSIYAGMAMDEALLMSQIEASGARAPNLFFRLAVRGDTLLGGFLGSVHPTYFSRQLIANDLAWWVNPCARGGAAALLLLAQFERWAKDKGAVLVIIGQTTATEIERTTKMFAHCGYRIAGMNGVKEL